MSATLTPTSTPVAGTGGDRRHWYVGGAMILAGVYALVAFGLGSRTDDGATAVFNLNMVGDEAIKVPDLTVPAGPAAVALSLVCVAIGVLRAALRPSGVRRSLGTAVYLAAFVAAFLVWAAAGHNLNFTSVLNAMVLAATPLILGALCGVLCERSGVINVAIEGQFLVGAFCASLLASISGSLWVGLVAGCLGGGLLGAMLAVFANRYLVQQVVLGVVLNLFAAGLTGFLYERLMQTNPDYNKTMAFPAIDIPGLSSLPVVGPVLFGQNVIFYITVALIAIVHIGLFHTRWGLRTRAVGEHPTAADTVGIRVVAMRYRNVILGGLIAGMGGAWLTIGLNITFNKNMAAGQGFIALAALIFGRWSPLGAVWAALLFGFAGGVSVSLQPLQTPVPTAFLSMTPYLATIFAVAGLVGAVRAPAADGVPYTKG
ncbi:ABC transporter permease [Thermomonospora curvata]|uniref:Inner-membrane translocator n=1 Tax=Thermomonospora curvata (strain ATCC 19995 / DSM 43183 / JCM 3096 / KCTC 9072 / NBRC 15933 / NCIMB 10081 / Henssen B9) TaxID=471852 RepID=D1A268_THECD|nr:ABC transporter permease [Thermomonospora curvata]ACY99721.1 inner-membrane translocator [Thermomonospora curvata DSM 43183]